MISVAVGPSGGAVLQGHSVSATVQTDQNSGTRLTMKLGIRGLPPGASASLKPASLLAGKASDANDSYGSLHAGGHLPDHNRGHSERSSRRGLYSHGTYDLTVNPVKVATERDPSSAPHRDRTTSPARVHLTAALPRPARHRLHWPTASSPSPIRRQMDRGDGRFAQTGADGSFSDTLTTPTGGPLTAGTWQVAAHYAGDDGTNPTTGNQSVIVQGP